MDNKLNFEEPMSELCRNASTQLSGVSHLQKSISKGQKEAIGNGFFFFQTSIIALGLAFLLIQIITENRKDAASAFKNYVQRLI